MEDIGRCGGDGKKMTTLNRQSRTQRKHKKIIGIKFVHLI